MKNTMNSILSAAILCTVIFFNHGVAGDAKKSKAEAALIAQLAELSKDLKRLQEQQSQLLEKRSAIYKQLLAVRKKEQAAWAAKWEAEEAAKKKEREAKASEWRAAQEAKKKEQAARTAKYRAEQDKKRADIRKQAAESRAAFMKRFDRNRDGEATRDEIRATLAEEAKRRAAEREKAKRRK